MTDRLGGSQASLVVYDNRVSVLMPDRPLKDRAAFHRALDGITGGDSTALYDGYCRVRARSRGSPGRRR